MALTTGIDPWSLINIPDHLFDAICVVYQEFQREQEKQKRRGDLQARLRAATGR